MIIRVKHQRRYTTIDNQVLEDERLSFKAVGVLAYLLSKPDSWEANYRHLATTHADGELAVRTALKELEDAGYIERRREAGAGGKFQWVQVIHELPSPCGGFPSMENPGVDNRGVENRGVVIPDLASPEAATPDEQERALAVPAALVDWPVPDVVEKGGRLDEALALCDRMARQLDARGYHVNGQARSKRWVLDMEQLIRLDDRTPHAVELVLDWLDAGGDEVSSFWRTNVRSPATLRARWQQMAEQYQRLKGRGARGERGNNFGMDRADVDAVVEAARNGGPLRPTARSLPSGPAGQLVEATSHEPREST